MPQNLKMCKPENYGIIPTVGSTFCSKKIEFDRFFLIHKNNKIDGRTRTKSWS